MSQDYVTIPVEQLRAMELRLKELEELEASLPFLREQVMEEYKKAQFDKLHRERDPVAHAKKMLEKYHANKEEINARRRAAYKAKKESTTA